MRIKNGSIDTGTFPLPVAAFYVLLGMPFLNITSVLTFAAILGTVIAFWGLITGKYRIDKYMLAVLGLYVVGEALALVNCPDKGRTLRYTVEKGLVLLALYPIMANTLKGPGKWLRACELYKDGCLISALFVWIAYFTGLRISFISTAFSANRLMFANFGPNVAARLFCIGALIAFYKAQIEEGRRKLRAYAEYAVIGFALATTISMSGILLLALGTVVIFGAYNKGVKRFGVVKYVAVILALCVAAVLAYRFIGAVSAQVDKLIFRARANQSDISNGRLDFLDGFGSHVLRYWLFGVGYACSNYVVGMTIHFPIIAAIVEIGVFGFFSVLYQYGAVALRNVNGILFGGRERFPAFLSLLILLGDMVQPNPNYLFTWFAIFLGMVYTKGYGIYEGQLDLHRSPRL